MYQCLSDLQTAIETQLTSQKIQTVSNQAVVDSVIRAEFRVENWSRELSGSFDGDSYDYSFNVGIYFLSANQQQLIGKMLMMDRLITRDFIKEFGFDLERQPAAELDDIDEGAAGILSFGIRYDQY